MKKMEELRDMLCEELEKITKKGELSAGSLDVIDKLTHSIKSIDTIIAMEESGYSNEYSRNSYARGGNRRGGSRGRNSNDGRMYSNEYDYAIRDGGRGYSRDEEMESLKMDLHEMLEDAKSEDQRRMIRKWIQQVEN